MRFVLVSLLFVSLLPYGVLAAEKKSDSPYAIQVSLGPGVPLPPLQVTLDPPRAPVEIPVQEESVIRTPVRRMTPFFVQQPLMYYRVLPHRSLSWRCSDMMRRSCRWR